MRRDAQGLCVPLSYRGKQVSLSIREGVRDQFIVLGRKADRTVHEEALLETIKSEMAARLLALPRSEVYDLSD